MNASISSCSPRLVRLSLGGAVLWCIVLVLAVAQRSWGQPSIPAQEQGQPVLQVQWQGSPGPIQMQFPVGEGQTLSGAIAVSNLGTADLIVSDVSGSQSWLMADPSSFTIPSGGAVALSVIVPPGMLPAVGEHYEVIFISHNDPGATNPYSIPVHVVVTGVGGIEVQPTALTFNLNSGASGQQTFAITNTGTANLDVTLISDNADWLSENPTSFTGAQAIPPGQSRDVTVFANAAGLNDGQYQGTITINSNAGTRTVEVTLNVTGEPGIEVEPTSLTFNLNSGESGQQTFTITNTGTANLSVSSITDNRVWLTEDPTSFTTIPPGQSRDVTVTANVSGLNAGTYAGTITIESNGGDVIIGVTLNVFGECDIEVTTNPSPMNFTVDSGSSAQGTITIANVGTANLEVTSITAALPWLGVMPTSFTGGNAIPPGQSRDVTVVADAAGLNEGTYTAAIMILSNDPDEPIVTVDVTLEVTGLPAAGPETSPGVLTLRDPMPNPSRGLVRLQFWLGPGPASLALYDLSGKEVHRVEVAQYEGWHAVLLSPRVGGGTYLWRLEQGGEVRTATQVILQSLGGR